MIRPAKNSFYILFKIAFFLYFCFTGMSAFPLFAMQLNSGFSDVQMEQLIAFKISAAAADSIDDVISTEVPDLSYGKKSGDNGFQNRLRGEFTSEILLERNDQLLLESVLLYGDRTVLEALTRFTGVTHQPGDGPIVRGLGPMAGGFSMVTVNGQRLASTGLENRRVDLDRLPVELFETISLSKSSGPNQPGDNIAGTIQLGLRMPETDNVWTQASYSRGMHSGYTNFLDPENRINLSVGNRYGDRAAFTAGIYLNGMENGVERLNIEHAAFEFNDGFRDVTESLSFQFQAVSDQNMGGYFNITMDVNDRAAFYTSGFAGLSDRSINGHTQRFLTNGDWITPTETGSNGNRGAMVYRLDLDESLLTQAMLTSGGSYRRNNVLISFQGGWSFGGQQWETISIPFQATGLNFTSDRENPARPSLEVSNREIRNQDLRIQPMQNVFVRQKEHVLSARTDFSYLIPQGVLSAGLSFDNSSKMGSYRESEMRLLALSTAANFRHMNIGSFRLMQNDAYTFQTLVSPSDAGSFFTNNYSLFRKDMRNQILISDPRTFEAQEQVYSSYVMTELNVWGFDITAGARAEYTNGKYSGRDVLFNEIGNHSSSTDSTAEARHLNLLPDLLIGYQVTSGIRAVGSWSRSIARQDYRYLTPFRLVHLQNRTLHTGNAELRPLESDNFDFMIRFESDTGSRIQAGAFHKIIRGLVGIVEEEVDFNEDIALDGTLFKRSDTAMPASGVEFTFRHYLSFLPRIGRNLGVAGGYAYTISDFSPEFRDGSFQFPGVSPHLLNAAMFYESSRLSAQLSFYHASPGTSHIAAARRSLPSLGGDVYPDRERNGYSNLNAVIRFSLSSAVDFWARAIGIMVPEHTEYTGSEDLYPWLIETGNTRLYHAGLRIRL